MDKDFLIYLSAIVLILTVCTCADQWEKHEKLELKKAALEKMTPEQVEKFLKD